MPKIKARRNFIISATVVSTVGPPKVLPKFDSKINIPFIPDEMIVKSFSFIDHGSAMATPFVIINTNLIDTGNLMGFCVATADNNFNTNLVPLDLHFDIKKAVNGTYTFNLLSSNGDYIPDVINGSLIIHLEFISYQ